MLLRVRSACRRSLIRSALVLALAVPATPRAAGPAAQPAAAASPAGAIPYTRGMGVAALAGRVDSDQLVLPSGRTMSVGDARRIDAVARQLRSAPPGSRRPAALDVKPGVPKVTLATAADLTAALKRPDGDTVQFPSGRRATVGQLKLAKLVVEQRLGRPLVPDRQAPDRSGPAQRFTKATPVGDWEAVLNGPDGVVIESPKGKRLTAGELKEALKNLNAAGSLRPSVRARGLAAPLPPASPGKAPPSPGRKP